MLIYLKNVLIFMNLVDVIYCTSKRNIKGQLTVTSDIVLFDPDE